MREFRLADRVYFSDTDAGGIAYHRSYLDWAEHGRTEMMRALVPGQSQSRLASGEGILNVVKSISIHYRMSAHLDDEIEIITAVREVRKFSVLLEQKVMRGPDLLADLRVKGAFINRETKRPVRVPENIARALSEAAE